MPSYFDASSESDLALLPESVRDNEDVLADIAVVAERDVVYRYRVYRDNTSTWDTTGCFDITGINGVGFWICLRDYNPDSALGGSELAEDLRQEIAAVVTWRAFQEGENPLKGSLRGGNESGNRPQANRRFPPDFGRLLNVHDLRPRAYVV